MDERKKYIDIRTKYSQLLMKYKRLERSLAESTENEVRLHEKLITSAKNTTNIINAHQVELQCAKDQVLGL